MDYSLLLGIHDSDQGGNASGVEDEEEETGGETDSVNSDASLPDSPGVQNVENTDPNKPSLFSQPVEVISIPASESKFVSRRSGRSFQVSQKLRATLCLKKKNPKKKIQKKKIQKKIQKKSEEKKFFLFHFSVVDSKFQIFFFNKV
jgi:hypothetical protein